MKTEISRREVLVAGGVATLGVIVAAGCASKPAPTAPTSDVLRFPNGRPIVPPGGGVASRSGSSTPVPAPLPPVPPGGGGSVQVMARTMWTRAGIARPRDINPMGRVLRITVHHEGVTRFTSPSMGDVAGRLEAVRRAHVAAEPTGRGWADIGYHYVIDPAGRVWEGRNIRYQGAHVKDQNENNLGIMCLGNFELQAPTEAQRRTLDRFVAQQMKLYRVPMTAVRTHRERAPTECPGRLLQAYIDLSRRPGGGMALALAEVGEPVLASR